MTGLARAFAVWIASVALTGTALTGSALTGSALTEASWANDPKQLSLGKHLSAECTSCHRIDGTDNGIPAIVGWPLDEFVTTMKYYKDGARPNPAMRSVADSLDDAQVLALATYFASLPKLAKKK